MEIEVGIVMRLIEYIEIEVESAMAGGEREK